jgi:hypothetical protein
VLSQFQLFVFAQNPGSKKGTGTPCRTLKVGGMRQQARIFACQAGETILSPVFEVSGPVSTWDTKEETRAQTDDRGLEISRCTQEFLRQGLLNAWKEFDL